MVKNFRGVIWLNRYVICSGLLGSYRLRSCSLLLCLNVNFFILGLMIHSWRHYLCSLVEQLWLILLNDGCWINLPWIILLKFTRLLLGQALRLITHRKVNTARCCKLLVLGENRGRSSRLRVESVLRGWILTKFLGMLLVAFGFHNHFLLIFGVA